MKRQYFQNAKVLQKTFFLRGIKKENEKQINREVNNLIQNVFFWIYRNSV